MRRTSQSLPPSYNVVFLDFVKVLYKYLAIFKGQLDSEHQGYFVMGS